MTFTLTFPFENPVFFFHLSALTLTFLLLWFSSLFDILALPPSFLFSIFSLPHQLFNSIFLLTMSGIDNEVALCAMSLFLGLLLFTGSPVSRENKSSNRHRPFVRAFELRGGLGDFWGGFDTLLKSFFQTR